MEATCKLHQIPNLILKSSCGACRSGCRCSFTGILRSYKTTNIFTVYCNIAIPYSITHIALNDFNSRARNGYHNTDMIRTPCIIPRAAILPIIEDHISSGWLVSIVFNPDPHILSQRDKLITATLQRDNIRIPCFNRYSGNKGSTPSICICYLIASSSGSVSVININNFLVGAIALFTAQPCNRCINHFCSDFFFCHNRSSFLLLHEKGEPLQLSSAYFNFKFFQLLHHLDYFIIAHHSSYPHRYSHEHHTHDIRRSKGNS